MSQQRRFFMKDGVCPECGSTEIYQSVGRYNNKIVLFENAQLDIYVCGVCGYLAEFIQHGRHLDHVRSNWTPVNKRKNDEVSE